MSIFLRTSLSSRVEGEVLSFLLGKERLADLLDH